ncbi:hypothetical protein DFP72DRAFT_947404 [Ephemerocybe angulata]|uniref:Uncharacterized protein n=1 Tax=Ephemerocybe angulata TaxID=980116 RepID=A0A8H6H7P0_9AGAR|nr:hypothetical protein DFP72DRAFT_947404 [Tulosesus angulatus]
MSSHVPTFLEASTLVLMYLNSVLSKHCIISEDTVHNSDDVNLLGMYFYSYDPVLPSMPPCAFESAPLLAFPLHL